MASKVNTKFVIILVGAIVALAVGVGGLAAYSLRMSGERNIAAGDQLVLEAEELRAGGDEAEAIEKINDAASQYGRAVNKDPSRRDWLLQWRDTLLRPIPEKDVEYRKQYVERISGNYHAEKDSIPGAATITLVREDGGAAITLSAEHWIAAITATDTHAGRREALRTATAGLANVTVVEPDEVGKQKYDLILLDVPCSNTGVLARRPEARYRYSQQSLGELVKLQREIIEQARAWLAPDGLLLYSTCSIEPPECQKQVKKLVRQGAGLLAEHQQLPQGFGDTYTDGSYHALVRF